MYKESINEFATLLHYAANYLPKHIYEHSVRVMLYVMCNEFIPKHLHGKCIRAAIAHDLLEDGGVAVHNLPKLDDTVFEALELLTKPQSESYVEYIKDIAEARGSDAGQVAYWVKMADMKDHLSKTETLTDKLKNKYLEALPFLLP